MVPPIFNVPVAATDKVPPAADLLAVKVDRSRVVPEPTVRFPEIVTAAPRVLVPLPLVVKLL